MSAASYTPPAARPVAMDAKPASAPPPPPAATDGDGDGMGDVPARALRASRLSLVAGGLLLLVKAAAWWQTQSVALLADALESIVNVAAAAAAVYAVSLARRPPDARHPFGHTKAEYLSAVLEGTLVLIAAAMIVQQSWPRLVAPQAVGSLSEGLLLAALAGIANAALAAYLQRAGTADRSPALRASAAHLWGDVVTTAAVIGGLLAARATGWWRLDPLIGLLVGANVVRLGIGVLRDSMGGLMDEALPRQDLERLESIIRREMGGALQFHDLRTRRAGPGRFVELHLVVPGAMRVDEAHQICDRIEAAIGRELPGTAAVVHVEPEAELQRS
jgi:cation diffusion facilitator family transporter